ncbi:MAG: hypothetical protein IKM00_01440, partial [Clostridia bacterium]|nr:hypothetical protein [Clostridia bacterium]
RDRVISLLVRTAIQKTGNVPVFFSFHRNSCGKSDNSGYAISLPMNPRPKDFRGKDSLKG